ncbi:glucokinase [Rhodobacter xanthinilyticus]|uniref:Glucokinase n=1 Tax=Rhodobacter xanthinilyticus TaxID=1850250 RepID=A0A1D9MCJ1_9RHOB|nr:glucokinase [Rhodobacter xanthinilyticus]AOZ69459.1 glucokinase [Rhodobacter xanthinilyticus]
MNDQTRLSLLADIGGTNTRVALAEGGRLRPETIARFTNAGRASLEEVLAEYCAAREIGALAGACVAVAGPVAVDGSSAVMTNLDWQIRAERIAEVTGAGRVAILNDLQAQGYALGHLAPGATRVILPGAPAPRAAGQLVIGLGTGFNAAPVHEAHGLRFVAASECGHISMPVQNARDMALMHYVQGKHLFASVEHVLSGRGFERVYGFVTAEAGTETLRAAAEIMAGLEAGEALAQSAGRLFVRMLGMTAGDLALVHLPFGGIYLCGGVARAFTPWLERFGFAEAFHAKGRFSEMMEKFPISVIEDDYAALTGCAAHLETLAARK